MLVNRVERGRYFDSVALMRVARRLEGQAGVEAAALMIGSPSNKALLREAGLLAPEGEQATASDLLIAVRGAAARQAVQSALELLSEAKDTRIEGIPHARSLRGALELLPHANLALISTPGEFAAFEARRALERGLHAMVFSDNVSLEEERALKLLALDRGLLLMGPDCGTALIAGVPLAFCNAVPRGAIGIVSASGTGLQEVASLVARMGGGISHGIGVGGRDLDARVGALGTLAAFEALEKDASTSKIVLISKPPAPGVAEKVLERVRKGTKPCIVCFLGLGEPGIAPTLRDAAEQAMGSRIASEVLPIEKKRGQVRGLYCGGTLCAEAEIVFRRRGLAGHQFVDLGADRYTRGRPHPMIEPQMRNDHVRRALADPAVAVILVDVVLGYGAHPDPASVLLTNDISGKTVIASVTGTEQDPQVWSRQAARLREAGVRVAPSNAHAAELAASLVS